MIENRDFPCGGGFEPRIDEVPDGGEKAWSPNDLFQWLRSVTNGGKNRLVWVLTSCMWVH